MSKTDRTGAERYFLHYDGDREREVTRQHYVLAARIAGKQHVSGPNDDPVADQFAQSDKDGWVKGRIFRA